MGPSALAISAALAILAQAGTASPTHPPEAARTPSGEYLRCQQAAARALDDGHSSEDAIATQMETRCETQFQAYRQTFGAGGPPGAPDQRTWNLDNERQARARMMVHGYRLATARIAEIKTCVRHVADEFKTKPFDQIVDQGVLRCGPLIPFPVTPKGLQTTMTEQQVSERRERQDRMMRTLIAGDLRQIVKPDAPAAE